MVDPNCPRIIATRGDGIYLIDLGHDMDQIAQYSPPPNPAKVTDSRSDGYIEQFGNQSWELDALEPQVLDDLITTHIGGEMDLDLYRVAKAGEDAKTAEIVAMASRWGDIQTYLSTH